MFKRLFKDSEDTEDSDEDIADETDELLSDFENKDLDDYDCPNEYITTSLGIMHRRKAETFYLNGGNYQNVHSLESHILCQWITVIMLKGVQGQDTLQSKGLQAE